MTSDLISHKKARKHVATIQDTNSSIKDYFLLMKPRVMSLVVFTAFVAMILAPVHIHPLLGFTAIICISLGAGSAAVINMWYDLDIDKLMKRTQNRPLVKGTIEPQEALSFGLFLGLFSCLIMAISINLLSAFLLLTTILYYVFIYTIWLKRTSPQNVVIGGVAGALPPMIGWAAVTGEVSLASFTLFAIIFLWTPPHSWALALLRREDYRNCAVPMMPVAKGITHTKNLILFYSVLMVASTLLPYYLQISSIWYFTLAVVLGIIFLYYAVVLFTDKSDRNLSSNSKKLFFYSIFYLFLIFLGLLF